MSGKYKPDASQQCSVSVKEQQDREEMAAREQWTDIVNFCKVVSYLVHWVSLSFTKTKV